MAGEKVGEWKTGCKFGDTEGVAHVVEFRYDRNFTSWFGCVSVPITLASSEDLARYWGKDFLLTLDDGRTGQARVLSLSHVAKVVADADGGPTEVNNLYVVGLGQLAVYTPLGSG